MLPLAMFLPQSWDAYGLNIGIVLVFGALMLFMTRPYRLGLLVIASLCLDVFSMPFGSFQAANKMLVLIFLLTEAPNWRPYFGAFMRSPLRTLMIFVTLCILATAFTSPHAQSPTEFISFFSDDLLVHYYVVAYAFVVVRSERDMRALYRCAAIGLAVLTVFATIHLLTGRAFLLEMAHGISQSGWGENMADADRPRFSGMFRYPFDYGFVCNAMLLLFWYGRERGVVSRKMFMIVGFLCLYGVVICGCRTLMVTTVLSTLAFVGVRYSAGRSLKYALGGVVLVLASYGLVPQVQEKIDTTMTAFNSQYDRQGEKGSSLNGRMMQYATAYAMVQGHQVFGRGYRYFNIDLAYNKRGEGSGSLKAGSKLLGLEGVLMGYLLERGWFGVAMYLIYYGTLYVIAIRYRRRARAESAGAVSVIIAFVAYGNLTGELDSAFIALLLTGVFLKLAYLKARQPAPSSAPRRPSENVTQDGSLGYIG